MFDIKESICYLMRKIFEIEINEMEIILKTVYLFIIFV